MLEYKRQWNKAKFDRMMADLAAKDRQIISITAKFETDIMHAIEVEKLKMAEELLKCQAEAAFYKKQWQEQKEELE